MTLTERMLRDALAAEAVVRGPVVLASGAAADAYVDARRVTAHGAYAHLVGRAVWARLAGLPGLAAVGGPATGAIPVATAAADAAFRLGGVALAGFYVRAAPKGHGAGRAVEGRLEPGWVVAVVDDVVTTGGSLVRAVGAVRAAGAEVAAAVALVDRGAGAAARLAAAGVPRYHAVFAAADLGVGPG